MHVLKILKDLFNLEFEYKQIKSSKDKCLTIKNPLEKESEIEELFFECHSNFGKTAAVIIASLANENLKQKEIISELQINIGKLILVKKDKEFNVGDNLIDVENYVNKTYNLAEQLHKKIDKAYDLANNADVKLYETQNQLKEVKQKYNDLIDSLYKQNKTLKDKLQKYENI